MSSEYKNIEGVSIFLTILITLLCVLFIYLYITNYKQFPYNCINSLSTIIIIFFIIFNQLYSLITYLIQNKYIGSSEKEFKYDRKIFIRMITIKQIFLNNLTFIPVLIRLYLIYNILLYNYNYLKIHIYQLTGNVQLSDTYEYFRLKFIDFYRKSQLLFSSLITSILVLFTIFFFLIQFLNEDIYRNDNMNPFYYVFLGQKSYIFNPWMIFVYINNFIYLFIAFFFFILILHFNIGMDSFYLKLELLSLIITFYLESTLIYFIRAFCLDINKNILNYFIVYDSIFNLLKIISVGLPFIFRYIKFKEHFINDFTENLDKFINSNVELHSRLFCIFIKDIYNKQKILKIKEKKDIIENNNNQNNGQNESEENNNNEDNITYTQEEIDEELEEEKIQSVNNIRYFAFYIDILYFIHEVKELSQAKMNNTFNANEWSKRLRKTIKYLSTQKESNDQNTENAENNIANVYNSNSRKDTDLDLINIKSETLLPFDIDEYIQSKENKIKDQAKEIYTEYFCFNKEGFNANNSSDFKINSMSESNSKDNDYSVNYLLEFPNDIVDKIEENAKGGFSNCDFRGLYEEAVRWVVAHKLNPIFKEYKESKEEINKLEILTFFNSILFG